jgi:DNA-directed RNA polymerase specialized sigma24 family protein
MSDEAIRARAELDQYRIMRRKIDLLKERIAKLHTRIEATNRTPREIDIQYMSDPKAIEELLAAAADLCTLYGEQQIKAERLCFCLERRIMEISGIPGMILEWRYIQGFSFDNIATRLDYSYRQVRRLHARALEDYAKRWPPMSS